MNSTSNQPATIHYAYYAERASKMLCGVRRVRLSDAVASSAPENVTCPKCAAKLAAKAAKS